LHLLLSGNEFCPRTFTKVYFEENVKDRLSPVTVDLG